MNVLFTLSTERFYLSWRGVEAPVDASAPEGLLHVEALRAEVGLALEQYGKRVDMPVPLRLAEQTRYRVFAQSLTGQPLTLRHEDPLAVGALIPEKDDTVLSGIVDFSGQVGRSRFVIAVGGEEEVAFEVEVFPTKATFAETGALRKEIDEVLAGLAFEYLRSTTQPTQRTLRDPVRATWLTLLRRGLASLERSIYRIAARPQYDLRRVRRIVRAERVQHVGAVLRRAVLRSRGKGAKTDIGGNIQVHSFLPEHHAVLGLDTAEHRWLRHQIATMRSAVYSMRREESRLPLSDRRRAVQADLADAEQRLACLLRRAPLQEAASVRALPQPTQRLLTAPGYAEAYETCRLMAFGLELAAGPEPHATRDLHALYEVWTYLAVVRALARALGQPVPPASFFRAEHRGVRLRLRRGRRHSVMFQAKDRTVRIDYNPRFAARPGLLAQRPDILISVVTRNATRRYVLDAKYRRDDSFGYSRKYGVPGPPEDALGDLHRYRDAILDTTEGCIRRTVQEAVALYPYSEAEGFDESRLWKSIETVGVGALPLLPGQTAMLDRWLSRVLA